MFHLFGRNARRRTQYLLRVYKARHHQTKETTRSSFQSTLWACFQRSVCTHHSRTRCKCLSTFIVKESAC
ncbi:hypothetical protein HanRHA438_Chr02g0093611 [Helianthus annuus]|nr:hypothetical protein HanIR_Chr02g0095331 [Helianthus annuus]KAJ0941354.1 hypothetical protein HanRHA438_Chr02g0093611 [Helianthus annuus]